MHLVSDVLEPFTTPAFLTSEIISALGTFDCILIYTLCKHTLQCLKHTEKLSWQRILSINLIISIGRYVLNYAGATQLLKLKHMPADVTA
jgi:hypothetical protein